MTETPNFLPQTPPGDLLSDLLDTMHLSGTVLFRAEFEEPWSITTPNCHQLARMLPFHTEHIIPFHVIAAGGCTMEMTGCDPVWLKEGDAVMLPYGDDHLLGGTQKTSPVTVGKLLPPPPWADILVVEHGGPGPRTTIICGFVQCDELRFHPILRELPRFLHVTSARPIMSRLHRRQERGSHPDHQQKSARECKFGAYHLRQHFCGPPPPSTGGLPDRRTLTRRHRED